MYTLKLEAADPVIFILEHARAILRTESYKGFGTHERTVKIYNLSPLKAEPPLISSHVNDLN
jgi:hypothetical protein